MDEQCLQLIRGGVSSFLADCGRRFDGAGRLLEIASQKHEGAAAYFPQAQISTHDPCRSNLSTAPSASFEWVVCAEVLEQFRDPFAAVREIHRVLKPGGHVFITTPFNFGMPEDGLRGLLRDFTIVSLDQIDTSERPRMPAHYRMVARKNESTEPSEPPASPEFSALIACYNEEHSIEEFHARLSKALTGLGRSFEIIFVNDGSADRTFEKLGEIFERDAAVSAILDLFRNAGQQAAVTAALEEARGSAFLLMDSDLQLDPEELPVLLAEYDKGFDVVSGARRHRKDSWLRIIPSKLANIIMRKATQSEFRDFGCTFKILSGRLVRAFDYGPHRLFSVVDVIARAGRRCEVPVTHHPRRYGASGWTFGKLLRYNTDNLVSLSERPFQILAAWCLTVAGLFGLRILLGYIFPVRILGSISNGLLLNAIVISLLIIVGVMCMIGEFAIRSFVIGRNLPFYVVREMRRRNQKT